MYRVRLHGQSSFLNAVTFASGWLPSIAVDSLGTRIYWDEEEQVSKIKYGDEENKTDTFQTGRRLVLFGPEEFREAPSDHRLVVAMGANPDAYFQATSEALATIASITQTPSSNNANSGAFRDTLLRLRTLLAKDSKAITGAKLKLVEAEK